MTQRDRIKNKIAQLERELAEIDEGTFEVFPGTSFDGKGRPVKHIIAHCDKPEEIRFEKNHIIFVCGESWLRVNIVEKPDNAVFDVTFKGNRFPGGAL